MTTGSPSDLTRLERNRAAYDDWSSAVSAWTRWDRQWSQFSAPIDELLLAKARIRPGMQVLDVAGGSGDPALPLARAIGPSGRVTVADFVADMLIVAQQRAEAEGLANVVCVEADAENLPFADGAFDAVTCRFGLYYPSEPLCALREMRRVLKPSGRVVLVTWGPFEINAYWSAGSAVLADALGAQTPEPPREFRLSDPKTLATMMETAGLTVVRSELARLRLRWPGPPEELAARDLEEDLAAVALPLSEKRKLRSSLEAAYRRFTEGDSVTLPSAVVMASGVR
jgi:SAM-dependent methyltransferase